MRDDTSGDSTVKGAGHVKMTVFGRALVTVAAAAVATSAVLPEPPEGSIVSALMDMTPGTAVAVRHAAPADTDPSAGAGFALHADARVDQVQTLIDPWCRGVPVTMRPGSGGQAGYTQRVHPLFGHRDDPAEFIEVGLQWPAEHAGSEAVALHECAHILQYRAYDYDYVELEQEMGRVFPDGRSSGIEHMADCMADQMGAVRVGVVDGGGYVTGYGGGCSPAQQAAATRLIAGQKA